MCHIVGKSQYFLGDVVDLMVSQCLFWKKNSIIANGNLYFPEKLLTVNARKIIGFCPCYKSNIRWPKEAQTLILHY